VGVGILGKMGVEFETSDAASKLNEKTSSFGRPVVSLRIRRCPTLLAPLVHENWGVRSSTPSGGLDAPTRGRHAAACLKKTVSATLMS
jgi:hypothetical protein